MQRIKAWLYRFDTFDALSLGLMLVVLALALRHWNQFPVHMDTYYHIGVTAGFTRAGGIALHSFWEFAPAGRAQLYPPLLHVIMFALTKCGLSMATVGRLTSFAAFPLLVLSAWYGVRTLFSSRTALYSTVVLSSCYLLFWHTAVESAASLVLILAPLVFVAVERDRKVAAAILLALALYSHLTLGHLVALGLLIYAVHRRDKFKEIFLVLAGAYVLWLPWGVHILRNLDSLSLDSAGTSGGVSVHLLVWGVALAGFVYCYFKRERYYLLPSFLLGMIPIVFFYPDRFWSAHAFLPLAMLGGVALSALHGKLKEKLSRAFDGRAAYRVVLTGVMAVPVALVLLLDPVYAVAGSGRSGTPGPLRQLTAAQASPSGQGQSPAQGQTLQQGLQPQVPAQGLPGATGAPPINSPQPGNANTLPPITGGNAPQWPPDGAMQGAGAIGGPAGPGIPGALVDSGLSNSNTLLLSLVGSSDARPGQRLTKAVIDSNSIKGAALIKANSTADQIVFCPDGSLGNMITGLTGRSSTGGMFHEVKSTSGSGAGGQGGSYQYATLIVVPNQNIANGVPTTGPRQQGAASIDTSKLELVGKAGNYTVYRNKAATAASLVSGTVIPWFAVFALLALLLAAAAVDWFRPGPSLDHQQQQI